MERKGGKGRELWELWEVGMRVWGMGVCACCTRTLW